MTQSCWCHAGGLLVCVLWVVETAVRPLGKPSAGPCRALQGPEQLILLLCVDVPGLSASHVLTLWPQTGIEAETI